ncbi:MAG: VanW family protein [Oscillospiraceae bacterium]
MLAAAYLVCCVAANARDSVFPNISVAGVNIGGMTYEEASSAVASVSGGESLHVDMGYGNTLDIPISEVMGGIDLNSALEKAWAFGRGGFLAGGVRLISSQLRPRDFAVSNAGPDEDVLRRYVQDAVKKYSAETQKYALLVAEDKILIKKGVTGIHYNEDKLYQIVLAAFTKPDFSDIIFEPEVDAPEEPDYQAIYNEVYSEPVDAYLDDDMNIVPEVTGKDFDIDELKALVDGAEPGKIVALDINVTQPEILASTISATLFKDVLSEYSTYVTNDSNRNNNINLAASAINGTVLKPGEVFSYNDTVGQRTIERGFKYAHAYVNGNVVDEVGGGICQVSSTIYMTALLANLEIVERVCHQFTVSYLPFGMDATVNWGTTDLKFKNNTEYPIKIESKLEDGMVKVRLLGTKTDKTRVEMTYVITATYPFDTIEKEDPSVAPGTSYVKTTGSTGYSVVTYRHIYDENGTKISSKLEASSYYTKRDKVVLVAVGELSPTPDPEPSETLPLEPTPSPSPTPEPTEPPVPFPTPTPSPEPSPTIPPEPSPSPGEPPAETPEQD